LKKKILIIDDEEIFVKPLVKAMKSEGFEVASAEDASEGFNKLSEDEYDMVLTDLKMPGIDGIDLTTKIKSEYPDISVIIMTAYGSIETAVNAMRAGAEDYILKPFSKEEILLLINRALEYQEIKRANLYLQKKNENQYLFGNIIGVSKKMQEISETIKNVLNIDTTVLITGETGTGKELVANAIHFNSERRQKPFIQINCAAIPENLFESELFGFTKGSFTGADRDKKGFFQLANGGTLFLDEIGDVPLNLQAKLLYAIQEKKVMKIGAQKPIEVDVKIISATNKDLTLEVERGGFRKDLYFRLNIVPLHIPPLREREEDIPVLTEHFIKKYSEKCGKKITGISNKSLNFLIKYSWPGNVRELEHLIERAVIMEKEDEINNIEKFFPSEESDKESRFVDYSLSFKEAKEKVVSEFEKNYIYNILKDNQWKLTQAAKHANIDKKNFYEKMKKYNITKNVDLGDA